MERLPRELIDAILRQCLLFEHKNLVLELRLVCRAFERVLKPFVCRNLDLDYSRLSRTSKLSHPQMDALQTIGYHCKSLCINLMVLRDELEVEFLETVFARIPSMKEFCQTMHQKYCFNETSFTELEYYKTVESMLFNCSQVDSLRLTLPFQLIGRHCDTATRILANTLKAFASRSEEDSKPLETLVIENVTDVAVCHLWMNPSDVMNIIKVLENVKNLVMTLRRHENDAQRVLMFGSFLWNILENAEQLETLCLVGMDQDDRPPRGLKQTKFWQMPENEWRARTVPPPPPGVLSKLTCLELKRVELSPDAFIRAAETFGPMLQEIYLNEVFLKAEQSEQFNEDTKKILWIGVPNQRPAEDSRWIAMRLRCAAPQLRICRASFLAYDHYLMVDVPAQPEFDLVDPCGRGRSVSQRFVEVVMGVRQPSMSSGEPVEYLPHDSKDDHLLHRQRARTRAPLVTEHDTNAYQTAVANTTSPWLKSIDGIFRNCNKNTLDELHHIAETAYLGMGEIHRRRSEWTAGSSMANEYTDNLFDMAQQDELQQWGVQDEQQYGGDNGGGEEDA